MKSINNLLFLVLIVLIIVSLFSVKIDISKAQGSAKKYTVFKTENEGFKFYKIFNNQKFWAPLFAETPTTTSDKNQVATKEYVDNKVIIESGADIRYYNDEVCLNPSEEMVIGGTDRDEPYIGSDPSSLFPNDRNIINQPYDRLIYVGKDNFIRRKPVGIHNSKWVACVRIPSNPIKGYVVVPSTYTKKEGNEVIVKLGACDFTEEYKEYSVGLKRNFFTRPCSWSLTTIGGNQSIGIKAERNLRFLSNLKSSISSVSLDLYSNDGGYCWAKFKTEEGFNLEMLITRITSYNGDFNLNKLDSIFSSPNFDLSKLRPYGDGANYSQVGPLNIDNYIISTGLGGNWSIKVVLSRQKGYDYAGARIVKPSYMIINPENISEFWKLVNEVEMEGKTYNGIQWGANICKLVLWF